MSLMYQEIIKALDDANGITQDTWIHILLAVGDANPAIQSVNCFGGRYYLTDTQRRQLRSMLQSGHFIITLEQHHIPIQQQLALPPYIAPGPLRCNKCKGPFHSATGHQFTETVVACHVCYGRFAVWQMQKYGWVRLTARARKQLAKAKKKRMKQEEAEKKQVKKAQKAHDKRYGVLRSAKPINDMLNPIRER